jgi:putative SOS response-associated peptidase YedK
MPVIMDPKNYDAWLDPKIEDAGILRALLKPFPAEKMVSKPLVAS